MGNHRVLSKRSMIAKLPVVSILIGICMLVLLFGNAMGDDDNAARTPHNTLEQADANSPSPPTPSVYDVKARRVDDVSVVTHDLNEGDRYWIAYWMPDGTIDFYFCKDDIVIREWHNSNGRTFSYEARDAGTYTARFENKHSGSKTVKYKEKIDAAAVSNSPTESDNDDMIYACALFSLFLCGAAVIIKSTKTSAAPHLTPSPKDKCARHSTMRDERGRAISVEVLVTKRDGERTDKRVYGYYAGSSAHVSADVLNEELTHLFGTETLLVEVIPKHRKK